MRRFSKVIGRAVILDEENREYAVMRCKEIWSAEFPSESFENEASSDSEEEDPVGAIVDEEGGDLLKEVMEKRKWLCSVFEEPYRCEVVYLIAARQRYKAFLYLAHKRLVALQSGSCLVPASDILLMWLTHQSYPTVYVGDMKALGLDVDLEKVAMVSQTVKEKEFEEIRKLWDTEFNQPYE